MTDDSSNLFLTTTSDVSGLDQTFGSTVLSLFDTYGLGTGGALNNMGTLPTAKMSDLKNYS
jgi:hypothetical protein